MIALKKSIKVASAASLTLICFIVLETHRDQAFFKFFVLFPRSPKFQKSPRDTQSASSTSNGKELYENATVNDVEKRFKKRERLLKESCSERVYEFSPWMGSWRQIITSPQHKLSLCFTQKSASTAWQHLVYRLRHNSSDSHSEVSRLARLDNQQATGQLSYAEKRLLALHPSAVRVVLVRHPFGRLISGWNDKFDRKFVATGVYPILKLMPKLADFIDDGDATHVITFRRFVKFLVSTDDEDEVDVHFRSVERLCRPCEFPFNVVVKSETAAQDAPAILGRIGGGSSLALDEYRAHDPSRGSASLMTRDGENGGGGRSVRAHIETLQRNVRHYFPTLDSSDIDGLIARYAADFRRFGYTFDRTTLRVGGFD